MVPVGIGVDQLGRLRDGHAVAAADEGVALDHRGQRRMHAPRPEGDHLALARRALAPGGLGGDAGGLAEEPEERRLVLRPLDVGALDDEHRLVRAEERPLVHGPDVDGQALEQAPPPPRCRRGRRSSSPACGKLLSRISALTRLREAAGSQDLHGAREVDVRHLARLDLGLGGDVEGALGLIRHARHEPSRARQSGRIVPESRGEVNRARRPHRAVASQPPDKTFSRSEIEAA